MDIKSMGGATPEGIGTERTLRIVADGQAMDMGMETPTEKTYSGNLQSGTPHTHRERTHRTQPRGRKIRGNGRRTA